MDTNIDPNPVVIVLPTSRIASVNEYLMPVDRVVNRRGKDGKYHRKHSPMMIKTPGARSYQESLIKKLRSFIDTDTKVRLRHMHWYSVQVEAIFRGSYESYKARDVDNILKLTIDAIFNKFLKRDDKHIKRVSSEKYYSPTNKKEYLIITIKEVINDATKFEE